ncbi:MAG: S-layer homology domain-containing protein, partial [Acidaminococcaceae bacterium]|nr:S-layer homology domain-containing protein [Acidaminococcaceae bacterium]
HWAYDSVAKLAAAGVVDGYADGAFDGDKLMTRYEMAQIVAKAMAKGANVDKLAAEFADELDTLGVRVAKLEKGADAVKITGETRLRYWNYNEKDDDKTNLRSRIFFKGAINDDWTYTGMIENVQDFGDDDGEEDAKFQRAYVNGKLGGLAVQAGRYSFADMNEAQIYDTRMEGVQLSYGKDVKLTAGYGKAKNKDADFGAADEMAYAELTTKIGVVDVEAGWYRFDEVGYKAATAGQNVQKWDDAEQDYVDVPDQWVEVPTDGKAGNDVEVYTIGASLPLAKGLKLGATWLGNESDIKDADDGFIVALNYKGAKAATAGSWGLWAKWYDQPVGTYVAPTFEADYTAGDMATTGFEGYGVGMDYTLAKNIVLQVKYYDLEAQEGKGEEQTLYSQINFSF